MQVFVTINKDRMMTNADANVKNLLTKGCVIKDLAGILVIVSVNVINHVILENIETIKIVSVEKKHDKLTEEYSENINGNEMLYNETLDII